MKSFLSLFAALVIAVTMVSCEKSHEEVVGFERNTDFDVPVLTDQNTIQLMSGTGMKIRLILEGGRIAVDWGDGLPMTQDIHPEQAPNDAAINARVEFTHTYNDTAEHVIKIWSDELSFINAPDNEIPYEEYNGFTDCRFGACPQLKTAWMDGFSQTEILDLSGCSALEDLDVIGWPQLKSVNLAACTQLQTAYMWNNPSLQALDFSANDRLTDLDCHGNALTELLLPAGVESVDCSDNQLTELDVQNRSALQYFSCRGNAEITSLDLSGDSNLQSLDFSDTAVSEFNFDTFPLLYGIACGNTQMTAVEVSQNKALASLKCAGLGLNLLDVAGNPALERLFCDRNALTALDITGNPSLERLSCNRNALTALDVSQNSKLTMLLIAANQLDTDALDTIFAALPPAVGTRAVAPPTPPVINFVGNLGTGSCNTVILSNKGWKIETTEP